MNRNRKIMWIVIIIAIVLMSISVYYRDTFSIIFILSITAIFISYVRGNLFIRNTLHNLKWF